MSKTKAINLPTSEIREPVICCMRCVFWAALDWECHCSESPYFHKEVDPDQGCDHGCMLKIAVGGD